MCCWGTKGRASYMLNKPSATEEKSNSILLNFISLYFCSITSHERGWDTLNSIHMETRGRGNHFLTSTVQFLGGKLSSQAWLQSEQHGPRNNRGLHSLSMLLTLLSFLKSTFLSNSSIFRCHSLNIRKLLRNFFCCP